MRSKLAQSSQCGQNLPTQSLQSKSVNTFKTWSTQSKLNSSQNWSPQSKLEHHPPSQPCPVSSHAATQPPNQPPSQQPPPRRRPVSAGFRQLHPDGGDTLQRRRRQPCLPAQATAKLSLSAASPPPTAPPSSAQLQRNPHPATEAKWRRRHTAPAAHSPPSDGSHSTTQRLAEANPRRQHQ
ncbi:UNVERIFIED_CONTAM: hypothetical protein Sangu_2529000 [Sesamum angustifolium]|uniref:Uncharacterized protein n=1 Tax=Sesamum angustifolium TaxID=2727405 RepID=A0AAW2JDS4_9LAMI